MRFPDGENLNQLHKSLARFHPPAFILFAGKIENSAKRRFIMVFVKTLYFP